MTAAKIVSPELMTFLDLKDRVAKSKKETANTSLDPDVAKMFKKVGVEDLEGVTMSHEEARVIAKLMFKGAEQAENKGAYETAVDFNERVNDLRQETLSMSVAETERALALAGLALPQVLQDASQR